MMQTMSTDEYKDPFADLPGARQLAECLREKIREGRWKALVLFDIDAFHQLNQAHGEVAGDRVLEQIEDYMEDGGWQGRRLAGDLFGVVTGPDAAPFDAVSFSRGLRLWVERHCGLEVGISGGAVRHLGEEMADVNGIDELVFSTAHLLLLKTKQQDRGRITWLPSGPVDSVGLMAVTLRFYRELARLNAVRARRMEVESRADFLTGLANRRGFEEGFAAMVQRAQHGDLSLALVYMDSDSLKRINDTSGHDAGDRFIIQLSQVLKEVVRHSDLVSRWGADEFAVATPSPTAEEATALAERIRAAIAVRTESTMSLGVYWGVPTSAATAVKAADEALYEAKNAGKDRVVLSPLSDPS